MNTPSTDKTVHMNTNEQILQAKVCMGKVVGHLLHVIALHENNELVIYSDVLSSQVPKSFGAHAFNLTRDALFRYSVIRLCALWDRAQSNNECLLTVVDLVDHHDVILSLMRENCGHWASREAHVIDLPDEPEMKEIVLRSAQESEDRFGRLQGYRAGKQLKRAIIDARVIAASGELLVLQNFRDKHLAHSLRETRREQSIGTISLPKFREETALLKKTVEVARALYCWINGSSFDFESSYEMRREQAEALWKGCKLMPVR